jgi:hypothetical protein
VWASLLKGKTAVIQEVAEEMDRRDPLRSLTRLALTDGERALQIRVDRKLNVTLILDLMHALEKLWKAAYVFHAEGSLAADLWVLDRTLRILFGEVGQVVKGIRQSITKRALSGPKRKTLNAVADYLYHNRAYMRYDEYLANGWPIANEASPQTDEMYFAGSRNIADNPSSWLRLSKELETSSVIGPRSGSWSRGTGANRSRDEHSTDGR